MHLQSTFNAELTMTEEQYQKFEKHFERISRKFRCFKFNDFFKMATQHMHNCEHSNPKKRITKHKAWSRMAPLSCFKICCMQL
jgi:hypothetical protein